MTKLQPMYSHLIYHFTLDLGMSIFVDITFTVVIVSGSSSLQEDSEICDCFHEMDYGYEGRVSKYFPYKNCIEYKNCIKYKNCIFEYC